MREHIPTLLTRGGALLRHFVHFSHEFARIIEVGLVRFQKAPRDTDGEANNLATMSSAEETLATVAAEDSVNVVDEPKAAEVFPLRIASSRPGGPDNLAESKLIISVHIPKTGGTTFLDVLKATAQEILYMDYGEGIIPTSLYRKGELISESFESIADIESLPGRSVIHGHFRFAKYANQFPRAAYVTWLRDPVERLASHYFFWQRGRFMEDPLCNKVLSEKMTLEEFAQLDVARNVQYRFLSPGGAQSFDFIGITEEYERSLELFRRLISPEVTIAPKIQNTNPERQRGFYEISPEVRQRILALNELDSSAYVDGLHRFRQLCEQVGI